MAGIRFSGAGTALDFHQRGLNFRSVAAGAQGIEARDLGAFDFGVNAQGGDGFFVVGLEAIYAYDYLVAAIHGILIFECGLLNLLLDVAGFYSAQDPSHGVNLGNIFLRGRFDFVG